MTSSPEEALPSPILSISDAARAAVSEARSSEREPDQLALFVEVNGSANGAYTYDMWFQALQDKGPSDAVQYHDDLAVVIIASSVEKMQGATLDVGDAGLVIVNPNAPAAPVAPSIAVPQSDLSSPLELAVLHVLESEINPQIATHGGHADLVAVDEGNVAYLRLSGGCQGCGMAQVTLSQGISVAIKELVPQIVDVVDVTAHGEGTDPYFESAHHH